MAKIEVGRRARGRWLTLSEAATFLGVDETTLRGWADAGKVRVFRTPGGHRRFDQADLDALVQMGSQVPPVRALSPSPAIVREGAPQQWVASRPWYAAISERSRGRVRGYCAELTQIVGSYIAGEPAHPRHAAAAQRVGAALGREVADWGITPAQSTEVFLHFKMRVTEAFAGSHPGGTGRVESMRDADAFLGRVLQAMMEAYSVARGRRPPEVHGAQG